MVDHIQFDIFCEVSLPEDLEAGAYGIYSMEACSLNQAVGQIAGTRPPMREPSSVAFI
jgi:hypothetical protein